MRERKPRPIPLGLGGLSGRSEILRVHGTVKHDPVIDSWLADEPVELRAIAKKWFERMRHCGDDVREAMHDGCPVACIQDAPFAYVNTFKNHVNVGFFYGAMLEDPAGLSEGSGKRMRHVKLHPGREHDDAALTGLIDAAYADIKARLDGER